MCGASWMFIMETPQSPSFCRTSELPVAKGSQYHFFFVFFCFFAVLGFELRAYTLSHSISPFLWRVFQDRVSQIICLGWLWTTILLISASWVARITGMNHQHLATVPLLSLTRWAFLYKFYFFMRRIWLIKMSKNVLFHKAHSGMDLLKVIIKYVLKLEQSVWKDRPGFP
jgi:hypothetical protein